MIMISMYNTHYCKTIETSLDEIGSKLIKLFVFFDCNQEEKRPLTDQLILGSESTIVMYI